MDVLGVREEKAVYSGVFSGKIVITISAKASANLANLSDEKGAAEEEGMKTGNTDIVIIMVKVN